jgi:hypothetical protein
MTMTKVESGEAQRLAQQGTNTYSPTHPHEPAIPPALDSEGRCLVCRLLVERDELKRQLASGPRAPSEAANTHVADALRLLDTFVEKDPLGGERIHAIQLAGDPQTRIQGAINLQAARRHLQAALGAVDRGAPSAPTAPSIAELQGILATAIQKSERADKPGQGRVECIDFLLFAMLVDRALRGSTSEHEGSP